MNLALAALAFAVAAVLTYWFSRPGSMFYILDHPTARSLHVQPRPRSGGLAIAAAVYLTGSVASSCCLVPSPVLAWMAAAGLVVAGVSFVDDRRGLSVGYRLFTHLLAAAAVVIADGGSIGLGLPGAALDLPLFVSLPATILFVVWMINLYNFMDGMDGFAGGMAVFGFGCFAWLGWLAGQEAFTTTALVLAAAAAGFLVFNFPPARIFMGDAGSTLLGFFAAALMLWAQRDGIFPLWIGVLVFSPFIVDATVTLIRRVLHGEKFWQAHKKHYYQRLVELGWGHRRTVLVEYALMALSAVGAVAATAADERGQWAILAAAVTIYLVFFTWVGLRERRGARPGS